MEEKKRTIVMFGDSLTDYFPMEKLKDIDAQFINSGVAGDTIADLRCGVLRCGCRYISHHPHR